MAVERGLDAKRIQELDRQYVLHSWSVQNQISPLVGHRRRGPLLLGRRRQSLPRLRLTARQRLDRPPAPEGRRRDQGAGGQADDDRPADGARGALRARAAAGRGHARRPDDVVLHERRRRGERERDQARRAGTRAAHKIVARYRSYHGATAGAITLTGDPRRWPAEPGIPGVVRMLDPYTYRCPAGPSRSVPGLHRARRTSRRSSSTRARRTSPR